MLCRNVAWMVILSLISVASVRAEESLDDVSRHLDDMARQYRTIRYKTLVVSQMPVDGRVVHGSQEIEHEVLRLPDGRALTRYEARTKVQRPDAGHGEQVEETVTLSIYDGQYMYDLRRTPQRVSATKSQPRRNPHDPIGRLQHAQGQFEARVLPDRTFEGKEVYALEFRPRSGDTAAITRRMVSYTDRKTGLPIKTINYDKNGKVVSTATVVESKLNEDIPADHFVFHAPPGVEVRDMTVQTSQPAGPAGTQPHR